MAMKPASPMIPPKPRPYRWIFCSPTQPPGCCGVSTPAGQRPRGARGCAAPAWTGNPLLRRAVQAYLAAAESAEGLVAGAGLDEADAERGGFAPTHPIDALSPSNNPVL